MKCLQLDCGNSSAKWRLMHDGVVTARGHYMPDDRASEQALLRCTDHVDAIWVASVAAPPREQALATTLNNAWGVAPWFARTPARTGALVNSYDDPSRMGVDRWLVMLAAWQRLGHQFVVVDAGSATTIDIVADNGQHIGGYILPGPALMERALLLDTDRVRFAEEAEYALGPGQSTAQAVRHGIALAQVGALREVMASIESDTSVLMCGGAAQTLQALGKFEATHLPDLVFEGLECLAAAQGIIS